MRLGLEFYQQSTEQLAVSLLGTHLVRQLPTGQRLSGRIVEVEAYLSANDPASHSVRGPGKKNASMFRAAGTLYVYSIHSRHCLNVVAEAPGQGAAVLIRAIEPLDGWEQMLRHRRGPMKPTKPATTAQPPADALDLQTAIGLSSGPGRLCQALAIDRCHDGLDLVTDGQVWLEAADQDLGRSVARCSPRIGISQARSLPLRWFLDGHRFVSGLARGHSQGRHWTFESYPRNK